MEHHRLLKGIEERSRRRRQVPLGFQPGNDPALAVDLVLALAKVTRDHFQLAFAGPHAGPSLVNDVFFIVSNPRAFQMSRLRGRPQPPRVRRAPCSAIAQADHSISRAHHGEIFVPKRPPWARQARLDGIGLIDPAAPE